MKALLRSKACFLILLFISISVSAYSGDDLKPRKVKREIKQECRKQSGACSSYKVKVYKKPDKFKTSRKKISRPFR